LRGVRSSGGCPSLARRAARRVRCIARAHARAKDHAPSDNVAQPARRERAARRAARPYHLRTPCRLQHQSAADDVRVSSISSIQNDEKSPIVSTQALLSDRVHASVCPRFFEQMNKISSTLTDRHSSSNLVW
jgi:hypothetical protein